MDCVNALKRATFISTKNCDYYSAWEYCVNALKGATFISTNNIERRYTLCMPSVNALKGATFISTAQKKYGKDIKAMIVSMP